MKISIAKRHNMTHDLSLFTNVFIQYLDICEILLRYQCFSLQYPTVAKNSVNLNCHETCCG